MKNIQTIQGKLEIVERMDNSANGNPRYLVVIGGKVLARTKLDSYYTYDIMNLEGKEVIAKVGIHYGHETIASIHKAKQ